MKVINLGAQDSVIGQFMKELRSVSLQQDRTRFRANVTRLGRIEAYEVSKLLNYTTETIQTPLSSCDMRLCADHLVIATVFRAGLPLHQGFLEVFGQADNSFISAYRYYLDKECTKIGVKIEYLATPDLTGKTLIITDCMVATGESIDLAYRAALTKGTPDRVILASVITSQPGLDNLQRMFPEDDVVLVTCAIDPILNEHKYIVPGLGDAGDLMYGVKD